MRYVVLLRGVNVGGNNKVPKNEFKSILEQLAYENVITFINSGNAIFTAKEGVSSHVIQDALEKHFGFTIPSLVLSKEEITNIVSHIPLSWTNDKPDKDGSRKTDILFLFDKVNSQGILNDIGYNPLIEDMIYVDKALICSILRENQLKGSLQKLVGTKIYKQMTIRNVNTVRKLAELVSKE